MNVLLVEDDDDFAALVKLGLAKFGHNVMQCRTLKAAKQHLAKHPVSLIITDGLLPDGNGVHFISDVREGGFRLPIVFLSTFFDDAGNRRRLHELDVLKIYNKRTLDIRSCLDEINEMLDSSA